MKAWLKQTHRKIVLQNMGVFALILAILIGVMIAITWGDEGALVAMLGMFLFLLVILAILVFIIAFGNKRKTKKVLKAQEQLGININEELGEIEYIGDVGFSGDWLLYKNTMALALHRSFIKSATKGMVQNGKYRVPGMIIECVDNQVYHLIVKKKQLDEVNLRIQEFTNSSEVSVALETHINEEKVASKPHDFKSMAIVMGVSFAFMIVLLIGYNGISSSRASDKENKVFEAKIAELNEISDYVNIEQYTKDLKMAKGNPDDLTVYLDATENEGEYFLQVINDSDCFVNGTLDLLDEEDAVIDSFPIYMARPSGKLMGMIELEEVATRYNIHDITYYTYKEALDIDYETVDDYDDEYQWTNVIIDEADYSLDNVEAILHYLYGEYVVSDTWYNLVYIYNEATSETYEYNAYEYYDPSSCEYMAYLDLETRTMELYSFNELGESKLEQTWEKE